jgi:flagellar biosynthesis/type III secretory pathway ATPase
MDSVIDSIDLDKYHVALDASDPIRVNGKVTKVVGLTIEAYSPTCRLGSLCEIYPKGDVSAVRSEAVAKYSSCHWAKSGELDLEVECQLDSKML